MTKITSPSELERKGEEFDPDFREYLSYITAVNPNTKAVELFLDEEGNKIWELNKKEVQTLIKHLKILCNELEKIENDPDLNPSDSVSSQPQIDIINPTKNTPANDVPPGDTRKRQNMNDIDNIEIISGEEIVVNKPDYSNARMLIDVSRKPGYSFRLTAQNAGQINRIPKKLKILAGKTYKTNRHGDIRTWKFPPEAPTRLEYYLKNFMGASNYRIISYHDRENNPRTDWSLEVEKIS